LGRGRSKELRAGAWRGRGDPHGPSGWGGGSGWGDFDASPAASWGRGQQPYLTPSAWLGFRPCSPLLVLK
jgi:hypothetical protein